MSKPIPQREARRLRKRVDELESVISQQKNSWHSEWPSSIGIRELPAEKGTIDVVNVCRKLGHAVVVTDNGDGMLKLWAAKI